MKVRVLICSALVVLGASVAAYRWSDPAQVWVGALQRWLLEAPVEKAYLFTDKPLYAPGETIWYRAWLTNGLTHTLNSPSGVLFVELLGPGNALVASHLARVDSSSAFGDIALADTLAPGAYTLRAYTSWMKNAGESYFFRRHLTVTSARPAASGPEFTFNRLQNGDEVAVRVHLPKDAWGRAPRGRMSWTFLNGDAKLDSGRPFLNTEGSAVVTIGVPDTLFLRNPRILIEFDKHSMVLPVPIFREQVEIALFPEGGDLAAGQAVRVALAVRDMHGEPVAREGVIVDRTGEIAASFASDASGIGIAEFTPAPGQDYHAEIELAGRVFRSPAKRARTDGVALRVDGTESDRISVWVNASSLVKTPLTVLAHVRGQVHFAGRSLAESGDFHAELPRDRFPAGLVHLTVFDAEGRPFAERLVYNPPRDSVTVRTQADRTSYGKRQLVQLTVTASDADGTPVQADLAATVTGVRGMPDSLWSGMDIGKWLLIGSDLENGFEKAGLGGDLSTVDRYLMTKGWRRFRWNDLLQEIPKTPHDVETGLAVSGRVVNDINKRGASDIEVTAFSLGGEQSLVSTTTDRDGRFFIPLSMTDSTTIVLQAKNKRGRRHYEFRLDPNAESAPRPPLRVEPPDQSARAYMDYWLAARERILIDREYGMDPNFRILGNVTVEAQRDKDIRDFFFRPTAGVDKVVTAEDVRFKDGNALEMLRTIHPKYNVNGEGTGFRGNVRLFVDGFEVDPIEVYSLPASVISHIDLVWDETLLMTMSFLGGNAAPAAFYYTKPDAYFGAPPKGIINVKYPGYYAAREFPAPDYSAPAELHVKPDRRSTLWWQPFVRTNADGKATIQFWTGDTEGDYRVQLEGLAQDGRPVVAHATVRIVE